MHAKHVEPILDSLRHWFSRMEISTMRGGVAARDVSLFDLLEREKKNCTGKLYTRNKHVEGKITYICTHTARLWSQFVSIDTDRYTRSYFGIGQNKRART